MFYRGKHVAKSASSFKLNKSTMLLVSLALIVCLAVGTTIAYLVDTAGAVENTFTPTKVDVTIEEKFDGTTKENVTVTNNKTDDAVDAYIRARVIVNWVDKDGNVLPDMPEGCSQTINYGTGWLQSGNYYYWPSVVAPGGKTGVLITSATYTAPVGSGYALQIEILAEGIQSEPTSVVAEKWPVTVSGGNLTLNAG